MLKKILASFVFFGGSITWAQDTADESTKASSVVDEEKAQGRSEVPPLPNPVEEEKKDKFSLTYYEPMYMLWGNPTSKVNFSFKYQAFREFPLYLGYVQNIFWLLQHESRPFKDANFNPRVFYRLSFDDKDEEDYFDLIAYEHKSNGKSEPESRSYNASGAKMNWRFEYENWSLKTHGKVLWRYALDRTNSDISEYVGPLELGFKISQFSTDWLDRGELTYRFYTGGKWGQDFRRMSHEVGLSFRFFGSDLTPAFYIQYFNGYSESLLNYNKREENLRIGFLL